MQAGATCRVASVETGMTETSNKTPVTLYTQHTLNRPLSSPHAAASQRPSLLMLRALQPPAVPFASDNRALGTWLGGEVVWATKRTSHVSQHTGQHSVGQSGSVVKGVSDNTCSAAWHAPACVCLMCECCVLS